MKRGGCDSAWTPKIQLISNFCDSGQIRHETKLDTSKCRSGSTCEKDLSKTNWNLFWKVLDLLTNHPKFQENDPIYVSSCCFCAVISAKRRVDTKFWDQLRVFREILFQIPMKTCTEFDRNSFWNQTCFKFFQDGTWSPPVIVSIPYSKKFLT